MVTKEHALAVLNELKPHLATVDWVTGSYVAMDQRGSWGVWVGVNGWSGGHSDTIASLPTSIEGVPIGFTAISKR